MLKIILISIEGYIRSAVYSVQLASMNLQGRIL